MKDLFFEPEIEIVDFESLDRICDAGLLPGEHPELSEPGDGMDW
jgi:hypothetical protein